MGSLKENLIAARALIDTPEKWGKGEYEPRPGCYCAMGAVAVAAGMDGRFDDIFGQEEHVRLEAQAPGRDVVNFNDAAGTTHADIMALFDRAIAAAEATP
jgi:hypothetical protein